MAVTDEETTSMFPELDDENPQHKKLLAAAKRYAKDKAERAEVLTTAKEKEDGSMGKVIALMHECKLEKFKHAGVTVELIATKEKAQVKIEDEEEPEDDE